MGTQRCAGGAFTRQVIDIGYGNIYYRELEGRSYRKKTKNPGFFTNDKNKLALLGKMAGAIQSKEYIIRSDKLLDECRQYVYKDGKVVHSRSVKTQDDSSKGQAHGDRVIAAALAWHGAVDRPADTTVQTDEFLEAPRGSMAYRLKEYDALIASELNDGW